MLRRALLPLLLCLGVAPSAYCASSWQEGVNYFLVRPPQPTAVAAGQIEVTEVFSWACPACDHYYPTIDKIKAALPSNAVLDYVPAGFRPDEDWPVFQRAYYAAQILGLDKRLHDAVYDAIWKTGELAIEDPGTERVKTPPPGIQDIAKFFAQKGGVSAQTFVNTANSFAVDTKVRQADQYLKTFQVDSTPTIIVNGKYRVTPNSAGGTQQFIDVVKYLVGLESAKAAAH